MTGLTEKISVQSEERAALHRDGKSNRRSGIKTKRSASGNEAEAVGGVGQDVNKKLCLTLLVIFMQHL